MSAGEMLGLVLIMVNQLSIYTSGVSNWTANSWRVWQLSLTPHTEPSPQLENVIYIIKYRCVYLQLHKISISWLSTNSDSPSLALCSLLQDKHFIIFEKLQKKKSLIKLFLASRVAQKTERRRGEGTHHKWSRSADKLYVPLVCLPSSET